MKKVLGILLLCAAVAVQSAPLKKEVVGKAFPAVKVKDVVSGEEIELAKVLAKDGTKGAVVFFTSTKCPVAVSYEERTSELAAKYAGSVPFLALNANSTEDAASQTAYAKEKGFKFHVATDEGSKIAKEIGASCTPEYYLIDKTGKVVYHGPLDDSQDPAQVKAKHLADAIDAVIAGKEIPETAQELPPSGCKIKYPEAAKGAEKAGEKHDHGHDHSKDK